MTFEQWLSTPEGQETHEQALFAAALRRTWNAAVLAERERCERIADAQVDSIEHELPDGSGGSWTRKFGANVARSIAAAIRAASK